MSAVRAKLCLVVLVAAFVGLWAPIARAAVRVAVAPGWGESSQASRDAQRRAGRWKDALQLRLVQVVSSTERDRFAETAAVFERNTPVPEAAFASEQAAVDALSEMVADVVGVGPPEDSGLRETTSGERVAWGQWIVDDLAYECILAPSGDSASLVIVAVLASEAGELRPVLDDLIANLEGVTAPMPAFSLASWRVVPIVIWIALGALFHALMLAFVDRERDHWQAGTRAAGLNALVIILATMVIVWNLRGRELAIVAQGSSVGGLAVWIAVSGALVVGTHLLLASRFDQGVVQSAPASGAFASGTYSRADLLRSSISRSGMHRVDPAHGGEGGPASSATWHPNSQPAAPPGTGAVGSHQHQADPSASQSQRIVIDDAEWE